MARTPAAPGADIGAAEQPPLFELELEAGALAVTVAAALRELSSALEATTWKVPALVAVKTPASVTEAPLSCTAQVIPPFL